MPRSRTIRRAGVSVSRKSSIACPVQSHTPLTTSTVLRSNSLCTRGFSPISANTAVASLLSSRVCESTSANSHSTPSVGRGEVAKFTVIAVPLSGDELTRADHTARHPLAGVTGHHRRLVGPRCPVDLVVAIRRDVAEIVGAGVNDDRSARACQQVSLGEPVGGGLEQRPTILTDLQRGQISASVLVTRRHEVPAGG